MRRRVAVIALALLLVAGCRKPGAGPGPTAQDRAKGAPYPIKAEFPGATADLDGDWLVIGAGDKLTAQHLKTGQTVKLPTVGRLWGGFAVGGGKVVWADLRSDPHGNAPQGQNEQPNLWNWEIMLYDLATGKLTQVTHDAAAQWQPHTDGRTIVWEDFRHDATRDYYGYPDVYAYDIATGQEQRLTSGPGGHFHPRVDAGKVIWMDGRNNPKTGGARGCGRCPENNWDIFGYDLAVDKEFAVATAPSAEDEPDISGNRVAWVALGKDGDQVFVLDLRTGKREQLTEGAVVRGQAHIDGDRVVWMDERRGHATNDVVVNGQAGNADIFLYDLTARRETRLTGDWIQMQPTISGRWVAFTYSTQINPVVQVIEAP